MKTSKLSIIIPAYNEERTIIELLDRVFAADLGEVEKEIIVVDDGSTDSTRELLRHYQKPITLVFHEKNTGKGGAVRSGFAKATGDTVVVQDADLEYDPNDFRAMIACADQHDAQAVFGSRIRGLKSHPKQHGALPFFLGGLGLTFITNLVYQIWITDEPTCYKMVRRSLMNDLNLESNGFEFCPEITGKIAKRGIKIFEVPINYFPRSTAEGKKIKFKDGFTAVWTLLKHRI